MIEFYDTHAHCIKNQQGGILIGLEGNPVFDGTLNNCDVERNGVFYEGTNHNRPIYNQYQRRGDFRS